MPQKKNPELDAYKKMVQRRLEGLVPIFSKAAEGDFSQDIDVPTDPEEFSELYEKGKIILNSVKTKSAQLKELNAELEEKIKERTKELEEQIEFSETMLEAISDLGEGMAIVDPSSDKFIYANQALSKILGYSRKEILAFDSILDITPQDALEELRDRQKKRAAGESLPSHYETVVMHKKGHKVNLEVSVKVMHERGRNPKLIGIIRDISDKKQTEAELTAAHEELEERVELRTAELREAVNETRDILSSITDAYIHLDERGQILDLNRRAENLLGKKRGDLLQKPFWNQFPAIKSTHFYRTWKELFKTKEAINFEEFWPPMNRWVAAHVYPNPKLGVNIYLRDIHARKMAEMKVQEQLQEMRKERAKDEALLGSIGESVVAFDTNLKIIFANPSTTEIFGFNEEELVGESIDKVLILVDERGKRISGRNRPAIQVLREHRRLSVNKYSVQTKDGSFLPVSLTASPITVEGKIIGAIDVYRDIGKEKEIDRAKSEFVALASHQLRTPMTITSWYSEKLLKEKDEKKRAHYIREVNTANRRMINLVNALLDASRLELGTLGSDPEQFDLQKMTQEAVTMLRREIEEKRIKVSLSFDPQLKLITADKKLVSIIWDNLIANAVKYTPADGKVKISVEKRGERLHLEVSDTGMGIPAKQQKEVFQKLFRADNARQTESDGTGLGLYLTKSIVNQLDGSIDFVSKEGEGTSFFVNIPLKEMSRRSVKDSRK